MTVAAVSPHGDKKRLRDSPTTQSFNRLSKLQLQLIDLAYRNYASNPQLAPAGTASQHGRVAHDKAPSIGIAHLYSAHAVANYLGVRPRRPYDHPLRPEHQFKIKSNGWGTRVDPKPYATAQAAISRAFRRLETRGLVVKEERGFMYAGGIQLTPTGLALGQKLTGIEAAPRAWEARP